MAWLYEQDFEGLSNGTLNGQDGWSNTSNSFQVAGINRIAGLKALSCGSTSSSSANRSGSVLSSDTGSMYFAFKVTETGKQIQFRVGSTAGNPRFRLAIQTGDGSSSGVGVYNGSAWAYAGMAISAGKWYVVNWEFQSGPQHRVRVKAETGAWSSFTSWVNGEAATSSVDFFIENPAMTSGKFFYIDSIGTTEPSISLESDLVAYYKLDESSGNAADSSGNGITLTNNGTIPYASGKINNGADLEGSGNNQYFSSASSSLRINGSQTFSFWVKPESVPTRSALFCTYTAATGNKGLITALESSAGALYPRFANYSTTGKDYTWSTKSIPTGSWSHVVFVYDAPAGSVSCYVNGTLVSTQTGFETTVNTAMSAAYIGIDGNLGAGNFFDGMIDETGIWSRALTANEVSQLWNSGNGSQYAFTDIGLAFDNATDGGIVNPGTSLTYSHTCSGTNRILVVHAFGGTTDVLTGATYGGVAMTLVGKVRCPSDRWEYMWELVAPATGANSVVISSSSSVAIASQCASYTGAKQTSQPDNSTTNTATAATGITTTLTTSADKCWTVVGARESGGGTATGGTGTTIRKTSTNGIHLADSNGEVTPAGSTSLILNIGSSVNFGTVMASLAPVPTTTQYDQAVTALVTVEVTIPRIALKTITALVDAVALALKRMDQALGSFVGATVSITNAFVTPIEIAAYITAQTTITTARIVGQVLIAGVDAVSSYVKSISKSLSSGVSATAITIGSWIKTLTASISASASIPGKLLGRTLTVSVRAIVKIGEMFYKQKYTTQDDTYSEKYTGQGDNYTHKY